MDTTYVYTAYTVSAATLFGSITICKKTRIKGDQIKPLPPSVWDSWANVWMSIIDEISLRNKHEFNDLDLRIHEHGESGLAFGGFSVIFAGDFCQFEPVRWSPENLLFAKESGTLFEQNLITINILNNEHRFRLDVMWGKLLKRFWSKGLTKEDKELINTRVIRENGGELPECSNPHSDMCYAYPIHDMCSKIHANFQRKHIHRTQPDVSDAETEPPLHMLIIEADMKSSKHHAAKLKLNCVWWHRILTTCGDAGCKRGHKHIDSALCIHPGSKLIHNADNTHLEDLMSRGNETLCEVFLLNSGHMLRRNGNITTERKCAQWLQVMFSTWRSRRTSQWVWSKLKKIKPSKSN